MRLTIVTAVWGRWHLDTFFDKSLPAMLHESNLAALYIAAETRWVIYTSARDRAVLMHWLGSLAQQYRIEVREAPPRPGGPPRYKECWLAASEEAKREGSLCMYLAPDIAWGRWAFHEIGDLIVKGNRNIFISMPRALVDDFEGGALRSRELIERCLSRPHPVTKSYDVDGKRFTNHPEMLLWEVKGGWLCRMLSREMFVCDPAQIGFGPRWLPDRHPGEASMHVVQNLHDVPAASLAEAEHEADFYGPINAADIGAIRGWRSTYCTPVGKYLADRPILWAAGNVDSEELNAVTQRSQAFIEQVFQ